MNHFSPSLSIVFCITNSRCIGGPNSCVSRDGSGEKKGQVSPFVAEEIVRIFGDRRLPNMSFIMASVIRKEGLAREREREGGGKKNHNWSFFIFFHYFLSQALSTKSKCPLLLSRREEHLWAELRGASEIDGARIRSE